jgi:predicted transcriptional regulator
MSVNSSEDTKNVTYENILSFIRSHQDPVVTAGEIAAEFNITRQAANYRLKKLRDQNKVAEKKVGSSAKVWFPQG